MSIKSKTVKRFKVGDEVGCLEWISILPVSFSRDSVSSSCRCVDQGKGEREAVEEGVVREGAAEKEDCWILGFIVQDADGNTLV